MQICSVAETKESLMGAFYMIRTLLPWSFVFCFYTLSDRKKTSDNDCRVWLNISGFWKFQVVRSIISTGVLCQQITCMLSNKAESLSLIRPQRSPHSFWRNTALISCAQLTCKSAFSYSITFSHAIGPQTDSYWPGMCQV